MLTQDLLSLDSSSAAADQPDTPPVTLRLHEVGFSVLVKPADAVGARGCLRGRVEKKLLDEAEFGGNNRTLRVRTPPPLEHRAVQRVRQACAEQGRLGGRCGHHF